MVIVNKDAWAKLDAATQKALTDAARAAEERGWKTSESENERYVKPMGDKGIKIMKPSAQLTAEFAKIAKQIADVCSQKTRPPAPAILNPFAPPHPPHSG